MSDPDGPKPGSDESGPFEGDPITIDDALDYARSLIADLWQRRKIEEAATRLDPKVERRIAMELGGEQLRDLAEKWRASEDAAKRIRQVTVPRNSTVNFASARMYEKARRRDAEIKHAVQRMRQARAKFRYVYSSIVTSKAFAERLKTDKVAAKPASKLIPELDAAIGDVEAVIAVWETQREEEETAVDIDIPALRDLIPLHAARELAKLLDEADWAFETDTEATEQD